MKYIENVTVRIPEELARLTVREKIAVVDTAGLYTTTAHWLGGPNPWGLHQDQIFSMPLSHVRIGLRIEKIANRVLAEDLPYLQMSLEDHSMLLKALAHPKPSATNIIQPALARAVLPIFDSIEFATDERPKKEKQ